MAHQVESPPEPQPEQISQPLSMPGQRFSSKGIITLLVVIGLLLMLFTGLLVRNLTQGVKLSAQGQTTPRATTNAQGQDSQELIDLPGEASMAPLDIPSGYNILYEQNNLVYAISTDDTTPFLISTPGFIYMPGETASPNRSLLPILTPSGQLLYSGNGLWLTNLFDGTPTQIAMLPPGQVITSVALSNDGTTVAWSTEPVNGTGFVQIYAGPLEQSVLVYQHSANDCPCFRVFSFDQGTSKQANSTLLLTDDRGDHHAVQYGLWSLDISLTTPGEPVALLDKNSGQGPLTLAPPSNTLLYTSYAGFVPAPTDASVPDEAQDQTYANSLYLTTFNNKRLTFGKAQLLLGEQHDLNNAATYRWISTPLLSPDGHTLIYVEFSNDVQAPYDRHNAIYTVQISGSGAQLHASKPHLLATTSAPFIELGSWLNAHILTFYANGALNLLDSTTGASTQLIQTNAYDRVIAVSGQ